MKTSSKYFWYVIDMFVFALINAFFIYWLGDRIIHVDFTWFNLTLYGLAVFRAANLVSNEQVSKPLRAPFVDEKLKNGKVVEVPKEEGLTGAMGSLLYCPACTGTWIAMILFYSNILWPNTVYIIVVILALSGMERIFTTIYNFLKK